MKILDHLVTKVVKSRTAHKSGPKSRRVTAGASEKDPKKHHLVGSAAGCYFGSQTAHSRQKLRENGHSWNLVTFLTQWSQKLAKLI